MNKTTKEGTTNQVVSLNKTAVSDTITEKGGKIYLVGSLWNDRSQGDQPNSTNFPSGFYETLEEAEEAYRRISARDRQTEWVYDKAYLAEVTLGPGSEVTVLKGRISFWS